MKLGLETEAYHLLFQQKKMDIFDFIEQTWRLGLDGVEINIIPDWNLHPEFGVLESDSPDYLARIKSAIEHRNLFCELDVRNTDLVSLTKSLEIAKGIGADRVRTYVNFKAFDQEQLNTAREDLKAIVPLLKKYRIKLALENHEYETADEIIDVVKAINSPWVGVHCDVGNSMMAWEDPVAAVDKLAPYTFMTHFKDHIVTMHDDTPVVCGVPIGEGSIDVDECFRLLVEKAPITRICIETCFPYCSVFDREKGAGGVTEFTGAFEIKEPPFDPELIKPMDYYYPSKVSEQALNVLMEAQVAGVQRSVNALKKLRDKYCK
jgi:sugar phosphate isomerase/epimerase